MKPTVSFYTLGCRLNQSETAVIQRTFETDGYRIVDFNEPADYVVINTCTVTENGDADTRRLVNKANRINPNTRIALIGCQAQVQKEKLTQLPNVRLVVGNAKKFDLAAIIHELKEDSQPQVIAPAIPKETFTIPIAGIDRDHTRANIKIQDGCDFFCSFCEIPYARGRARSRVFEDILKEVKTLVAAGHKEVVLTGINIGTYQENNKNILDVLEALEQIAGLHRIRISSIEPTTIPEAVIHKMALKTKLCRHLHIPLQSGSNTVLSSMKRKYSLEEFDQFVQFVRTTVPEVSIGTDVIVGFPGETDQHFEETYNYLLDSPINYFHVFSYSKRHLALSKKMEDEIHPKIIGERSERLRDLSQRKRKIYHEALCQTTQNVLFEEQKNGIWEGLTDTYVRVAVQSPQNLQNHICTVKLQSADLSAH
jgi:threonylcarbamoyladenosine tRNA methylthiotransferase MtaB